VTASTAPTRPAPGAGRVLVLTGAAGGIGREIARGFARAGSRLVLADLSAEALSSLAEELEADGAEAITVPADVSTAGGNEQIVQAATARFGMIDDLVLGAGIYPAAPLTELTDEDWRTCLAINLDSAFFLLREASPQLAPGSSVVAMTSIAGMRGSAGHAAYAATKGGLLSLTRSMARELGARARVNAVAPGIIDTSMTADLRAGSAEQLLADTPLGRFGTAEEVAGVVQFLCSPAAGFITGEVIQVNGGLHMS